MASQLDVEHLDFVFPDTVGQENFLEEIASKEIPLFHYDTEELSAILNTYWNIMHWKNVCFFLTHEDHYLCNEAWNLFWFGSEISKHAKDFTKIVDLLSCALQIRNPMAAYGLCCVIKCTREPFKSRLIDFLNRKQSGHPQNIFLEVGYQDNFSVDFVDFLADEYLTEEFMNELYCSRPEPTEYIKAFKRRYVALEKSRLKARAGLPEAPLNLAGAI